VIRLLLAMTTVLESHKLGKSALSRFRRSLNIFLKILVEKILYEKYGKEEIFYGRFARNARKFYHINFTGVYAETSK
jgi:hypothetical protein